jgi:pimeloyl-ACP methyl ester carboxylesterase
MGLSRLAGVLAAAVLLAGCADGTPQTPGAAASSAPVAPSPTDGRCADPELNDKQVAFPGAGGSFLTGYVLGAGSTALVLAPQASANACSWLAYARQQATAGYLVLAFDFNGEGRSQRAPEATPSGDVLAAAAYARSRDATRVVLVGASRGGTAVLVAAARADPPVTAVVSLSAPGVYAGESAAQAAPKLAVPVLYVAATGDSAFADDARAMHDATADGRKRLAVVPGSLHGTALVTITAAGAPEAATAIGDFLKTHASP